MATTAVVATYDANGWGSQDQQVVWVVTHAEGLDVEAAMRAAVEDFFATEPEDAAAAMEEANGHFNWGDAMRWLDDTLWAKYGLIFALGIMDIHLNHDEVLREGDPDE